jgi:hypothetical protein
LDILESRNNCDLVKYGSQGTCTEIRMILGGASSWIYHLTKTSGGIPSSYASFKIDEFKYFSDNAGTLPGLRSMIQSLDAASNGGNLSIRVNSGFENQKKIVLNLDSFKDRSYTSLNYILQLYQQNNRTNPWIINLEDTPFLMNKLFLTK